LRTDIFGRRRPAADVISYRDKLGVSDPVDERGAAKGSKDRGRSRPVSALGLSRGGKERRRTEKPPTPPPTG